MSEISYTILLEPDVDGGYSVTIPALPGCITEGDTKLEALRNAQEAIELYLDVLRSKGLPAPQDVQPEVEIIRVVA